MIENSQQQRATGAAVESFRNETVKVNQQAQQLFLQAIQKKSLMQNINTIGEPI